ncbi:glutathione S-transferase, putative [Bodo saltans]|uniref:Glutathione S-transferase, putative n=1 Tax=Bodo saltans TaxID=75058 RepID=A0A0S4KJZ4_BODSA|nr:glutathione S-transferase, putative [Bodo saltans]|eukprot:CUI12715.1 glutathione S-transferase, putative [Bodo saltans]
MTHPLTLYGHFLSQPTRAVLWTLAMKGTPYNFVKINPAQNEADTEEFYAKFPTGGVPALHDASAKFDGKPLHLTESNAILAYLSSKNGWSDLYPTDVVLRAKVDQWLHWHHANMRICTNRIFRPRMNIAMGWKQANPLLEGPDILKLLRPSFLVLQHEGLLNSRPFLVGNVPTIADISVYCELDQLFYAKLLDLQDFPDIQSWMKRLQALPHHDEVRRTLFKFIEILNSKSPQSGI